MSVYDFGVANIDTLLERVGQKMREHSTRAILGVDRVLQVSGKGLRPRMVIAIAHHSGKKMSDDVICAAAAVELIHISSLIHDDMMDGGLVRHGIATINASEGAEHALLAGDYLLAKGMLLAAQVSAEAASIAATAITQLCEGQAYELRDSYNTNRDEASLLKAVEGKTSALFIAAVQLGSLVSDMDDKEVDVLTAFAHHYGIAFQYADDVHDFTQSVTASGKSVGNDVVEGKYTLPVILALKGPRGQELEQMLRKKISAHAVKKLLQDEGVLDAVLQEAQAHKSHALNNVTALSNKDIAAVLQASLSYF